MAYDNGWEHIQLGIRETKQLLDQGQYNLSMIKARQTLELMVGYLSERSGIFGGDLVDAIDQLTEIRFISRLSGEHYHAIRMMGNKAVHEAHGDFDDAQNVYRLLLEEVRTFGNEYLARTPRNAGGYPHTAANDSVNIPVRNTQSGRGREDNSRYPNERSYKVTRSESAAPRSSSRPPARSGSSSHSAPPSRSRKRSSGGKRKKRGITPYRLIQIGIIIIVLLLAVLLATKLVQGLMKKDNNPPSASAESQESIPETSMPEVTLPTTAPTEPITEAEPQAPQRYKVTADSLNLRAAPSSDANTSILVQIPKGEEVEFVSTHSDEWVIVRYNDKQGYAATRFISPVESSEISTTATTAAPSTAATSAATQ